MEAILDDPMPEHVADRSAAPWSLELSMPIGPQVHAILRQQIIHSTFKPGSVLSEAEIARRFSTSRQPVREAFIKLAEEGLLEVRPQRGTFICKISKAAVIDARFVREAIEADIVRDLAAKGDAGLIDRLRKLITLQTEAATAPAETFIKLDEDFHKTLADAAGRLYGWKVIEGVKIQIDRVRYLTARNLPREKLIRQHAAIVNAIERMSPDEAEREMRQHLRVILEDLPLIEKQYPDFFAQGT